MEHNINGLRDLRDTENGKFLWSLNPDIHSWILAFGLFLGRVEHDWRPPGPPKKSPVHKTGWNVIEISSSSENEEETGSLLSPSPNGLENGESAGKSPVECWTVQSDRPNNMLRRDYGKKTPYRIFQVCLKACITSIYGAAPGKCPHDSKSYRGIFYIWFKVRIKLGVA